MVCRRCSGLLVSDTFDDLREETARMCLVTRCINCGSIEDPVVRANRLRPPAPQRSRPHEMFRKGGVLFIKTHTEEYGTI